MLVKISSPTGKRRYRSRRPFGHESVFDLKKRERNRCFFSWREATALSLSVWQLSLSLSVSQFFPGNKPHLQITRQLQIQGRKNGRTYSQQNYVHSHIEISTFTIFQYTELSMDINVASHTHTFSQWTDQFFSEMYFFSYFSSISNDSV